MPQLKDIKIRTMLQPGDLGFITHLHGDLYTKEYDFGISFESYVARGLLEFYDRYDPATNRVWVCEHHRSVVGFILLMNRGDAAQLRYFIIVPAFRGIGLGKKLMDLFMEFFRQCNYKSIYLWTTHELRAAASLYTRHGFKLTEERESETFGKPLREQRYDFTLLSHIDESAKSYAVKDIPKKENHQFNN